MASGTLLRPFGPVSGSNVARGSSVLYLTRGDNVTPIYNVNWINTVPKTMKKVPGPKLKYIGVT